MMVAAELEAMMEHMIDVVKMFPLLEKTKNQSRTIYQKQAHKRHHSC